MLVRVVKQDLAGIGEKGEPGGQLLHRMVVKMACVDKQNVDRRLDVVLTAEGRKPSGEGDVIALDKQPFAPIGDSPAIVDVDADQFRLTEPRRALKHERAVAAAYSQLHDQSGTSIDGLSKEGGEVVADIRIESPALFDLHHFLKA